MIFFVILRNTPRIKVTKFYAPVTLVNITMAIMLSSCKFKDRLLVNWISFSTGSDPLPCSPVIHVRTGAMPRLPANMGQRALGMLQAGLSQWRVAVLLHCHSSTITRLYQRFVNTGDVQDRPRTERPRVTTPAQDANILNGHRRNRFRFSTETARGTRGRHG